VEPYTEPIRRSIEVEYWVVDEDGRLVEPGDLVDATAGAEREFVEPLLEVKTPPCETTAELRETLFDRVNSVRRRAEDRGRRLVPLGTPVNHEEIAELASERTEIQNSVVGDPFQYVRHCAGTHVHVEQVPGREVDQFNTLVALDPALALVNSSPFFRGDRVAAGARSVLYRRMAYADLAHQGRLWRYVSDPGEWTRRLERRYEEFVTAAIDAGVDRAAVVANFDPESAVWTPVQFREQFNTVEWRSPDAALPSQAVQLADDLTRVVGRLRETDLRIEGNEGELTDEAVVLPEFDAVLRLVDAAIDEGLESTAVRSYLERMGFDVDTYDPVTEAFADQETVSTREARRLRVTHADRLDRDLRQPRSVSGD
jgi:gamma-glutamyl:cysteine ligase YbdK (ATP-grasp superfamily)